MCHPLCPNRLILAYSTPIVIARNKKTCRFIPSMSDYFIYLQTKPCSMKAYKQKTAHGGLE
ncbi:hypothetical protein HMPREF1254_0754 [Prevotella sp. BV3P1]|nr:hypothetical protein HMPREF1254_0754 [Prevotella sp. BV3P1]